MKEDKLVMSPSGRYQLNITTRGTKPGCWDYTTGVVSLAGGGSTIETVERNFRSFPYLFVENPPNGHDYLVCGASYMGQTVIELDTGKRVDLIPERSTRAGGFCWVSYFYDPTLQILVVDGCYWACPYENRFFDFSNPMGGWPELEPLDEHDLAYWDKSPEISPDGIITCFGMNNTYNEDGEESDEMVVVEWVKYRRVEMSLETVETWILPSEKDHREREEELRVRHADLAAYKASDPLYRMKELVDSNKMINTCYEDLLREVLEKGAVKTDRTGTGTRSLFGRQIRFDLNEGFPLVTTKKLFTKAIVHELLWFIQGSSNVSYLRENGVTIWDEWARENGDLGPVYGVQWRSWPTPSGQSIDQLGDVIKELKAKPDSRRLVVSAWNVADLHKMALQPCHVLFQFYVADGKLSCQLYQRSADVFLGVPFNIASYALLTHMVAQVCGLQVGEFIHTFGDVHLYLNHTEQAKLQLSREVRTFPQLVLDLEITDIDMFRYEDIRFEGYDPHPPIKAPVAV